MPKLKFLTISIILVILISLAGPSFKVSASPLVAHSPTLGAAESYSVLAGQTVTNTGNTTMPGDLGVMPGSSAPGFPPGIVGPPGTIHLGDTSAATAMSANTAAFLDLSAGDNANCTSISPDLTGQSLVPGVYCAGTFSLSGTLALTGSGVWIFQSGSTLITSGTANVVGGDPCNVWWKEVSSATLGTGTSLIGNILASTTITLSTGASLNGRALAQTGEVTLDNNTITGPICAAQATSTPTAAAATLTATAAAATPTPTGSAATQTAAALTATAAAGTQTAATQTAAALTATAAAATQTATPVPPTPTPVPPTATKLPVVTALPGTGGAPIQNEDFPWTLVIAGGFSAIALFLGIRAYRSTYRPKQ
jgi:Ice-binding-like